MMETAQPLHPESQAFLDAVAKSGGKALTEQTVEDMRLNIFYEDATFQGQVEYDGTRKELFVPLPDFTGESPLLGVLYFHGYNFNWIFCLV